MMNSGVYIIQHRESGKAYVGRSTDIRRRWSDHRLAAAQGKRNYPLYAALRKYGCEAFDWKVLAKIPERLHVCMEECFIKAFNTMAPNGYNVGGAAGGQPPLRLIMLMDSDARAAKFSKMKDQSSAMVRALSEKRKDPEYDAWYRERQRQAALSRWSRRRERMESDPAFAEAANEKWQNRSRKAQATIKHRMETDPAFSAELRKKRSKAARKARANDPRTIRAANRKMNTGGCA